MNDLFGLKGRQAVITGGTQGVGGSIARAVAAAGADVLLVGLRDDEAARQTLAACRELGPRADLVLADLAQPPAGYLPALMAQVEREMPGADLLVNNAGTFIDKPYLEMDFDTYLATMHLNVTAGYFITQALSRRWTTQRTAGRVLFTGSINGLLAEPDHTAYDTSKGAVAAMVRSLAVALAPLGIRVNAIAPGLVRTPLTAPAIDEPRFRAWMEWHTPNREVPDSDVCGAAAVFLLSDAAAHIHGQTLLIDGGMSVWQQPDMPDSWQPTGPNSRPSGTAD